MHLLTPIIIALAQLFTCLSLLFPKMYRCTTASCITAQILRRYFNIAVFTLPTGMESVQDLEDSVQAESNCTLACTELHSFEP